MTDEESDTFVQEAVEQLEAKQADLTERFGIGNCARWWWDQPSSTLELRKADETPQLVTSYTDIGSYSPKGGTWCWGWANDTTVETQCAKSSEGGWGRAKVAA